MEGVEEVLGTQVPGVPASGEIAIRIWGIWLDSRLGCPTPATTRQHCHWRLQHRQKRHRIPPGRLRQSPYRPVPPATTIDWGGGNANAVWTLGCIPTESTPWTKLERARTGSEVCSKPPKNLSCPRPGSGCQPKPGQENGWPESQNPSERISWCSRFASWRAMCPSSAARISSLRMRS